jgi:hypothetical protein
LQRGCLPLQWQSASRNTRFSWNLDVDRLVSDLWQQRAATFDELLVAVEDHRGAVPGMLTARWRPRGGSAAAATRRKVLLEAYSGKETVKR